MGVGAEEVFVEVDEVGEAAAGGEGGGGEGLEVGLVRVSGDGGDGLLEGWSIRVW